MSRFVAAVLALVLLTGSAVAAPKKLLLLGQGPDGHPPQTHEYVAGLKVLHRCLKDVPDLEVTQLRADEPWKEGPELMERADGVVLYLAEGAKWLQAVPKRLEALKKLAARRGGIVVLHWAMGTKDAGPIDAALPLLGALHGGPDRKYKVLETDLTPVDVKHPILTGIGPIKVKDEFYYRLKVVKAEGVQPLLRAQIDGEAEMVAWAFRRPDGGRSFGFSGLHFHDNWRVKEYRRLVAQGVLWTLDLPIPKEGLPVEVDEADLKLK
jgi:hypothetical protein